MRNICKYGRVVLPVFFLLFCIVFAACSNPGAVVTGLSPVCALYAPELKPDLTVQSVAWLPQNPSKGDTITISVTIKNQGDAFSMSSTVRLYVDGYIKKEVFLANMDAGSTAVKEFTWIVQQGSQVFNVVVDEQNTVIESDENNNEDSFTITSLTPDLVMQSITWDPLSPVAGENVTFAFIVRNQGNGKAISSYGYFYIDGDFERTVSFKEMEPGEIYTATYIWVAETGEYPIKLILDPDNRVVESDDNNNELTVNFTPIIPDLYIKNLEWLPSIPSVGETVNFTVTIGNQGRSMVGDCTFHLYIGEKASFSESARNLTVGGSDSVLIKWAAEPGNHKIRIVVDPFDYFKELNESNNEVTMVNPMNVLSSDLTIDPVTWLPEEALPGETLTFTVTVRNRGYGVAPVTRLNYYVDGERLDSRVIGTLNYGNIQSSTFTWTVEEGSHTIRFVADSNNDINEGNEGNNESIVIYPVPPDLYIKEITLMPDEPAESDNVTFTFSVENRGGIDAENTTVACYFDGVYTGYITGGVIAAGESVNLTYVWEAQFGDHDCKVIIDPFNRLFEADEENNEKSVSFTVGEKRLLPDSGDTGSPDEGPDGGPDGLVPGISGKPGEEKMKTNMWFFSLLAGGILILLSYIYFEYKRRKS